MDQQTRFRTHDNHRIIFTNDKGIFKDQSSGYLKKYNIDFNDVSRNIIYRQWSQIVSVFRRFTKNDMLKMVNIYGPSEAGKSTLLEQLARLFIERGMYRNGVYIIKGK